MGLDLIGQRGQERDGVVHGRELVYILAGLRCLEESEMDSGMRGEGVSEPSCVLGSRHNGGSNGRSGLG